jgi:hypothetical protein
VPSPRLAAATAKATHNAHASACDAQQENKHVHIFFQRDTMKKKSKKKKKF